MSYVSLFDCPRPSHCPHSLTASEAVCSASTEWHPCCRLTCSCGMLLETQTLTESVACVKSAPCRPVAVSWLGDLTPSGNRKLMYTWLLKFAHFLSALTVDLTFLLFASVFLSCRQYVWTCLIFPSHSFDVMWRDLAIWNKVFSKGVWYVLMKSNFSLVQCSCTQQHRENLSFSSAPTVQNNRCAYIC